MRPKINSDGSGCRFDVIGVPSFRGEQVGAAGAPAVLAEPAPVEVLGIDEIRRVAFGFRNATREASLISRLVLSVRAFVTFSCRK